MDDPNITMEEYIRHKEERARKCGKVFNWETAKYGKIWYDEDIHNLRSDETKFPAIAFNDGVSSEKTLSCEPTVSSLNNEIDFRISFDDSDDEDYTVVFDKQIRKMIMKKSICLHFHHLSLRNALQDLFCSSSPLKIDFCGLGLEVGSIRRIQGIRYGVLEFLGVGNTFDIFQNLHILYLQYDVLSFSGYSVLSLFPLWSLVSAGTDMPYLP
ncbi:hypothetical protein Tco_0575486 [Tanacetum coccineum]